MLPFSLSPFLPFSVFLLFSLAVLSPIAAWAQLQKPAASHYDVVALRIEFQPDTTRFTTGDGTFDGTLFPDGLQPAMDPLPHDAGYFQAHLAFLEDYVAQVSDGQTRLTTHLVPEVVRVSRAMGAYSPVGFESDSDAERAKLVSLIDEAWATASQVSTFDLSGFDPERTAFVIFHAGVGRDVELLGTTLDKTPLDLPSISFSERELSRLGGGAITFRGMPVRHTLFLPRTESRSGFNFIEDTSFLFELSINGLLAASFFNYLGVPDLFNTETGEAVIGPFGLMDPLGIFAYAGLFPPEPSAWTKYYLGWSTPQDLVGDGPTPVTLQAAGLAGATSVARASISSAEYFLVENRNRDPEGDGLVLRVWQRGEIVEQHVPIINDDFNRFSVDGFIGGVVVGVDNYDFALPGIDADDIQYEGGILIWHVDERVLAEKLETGGVNADPQRRAVDLEEADSAQDLDAPGSIGAPFDFFFAGNQVGVEITPGVVIRFYENRFGPGTIPNSNSNEGGPSFITLEDFSAPGPEMTFVYRRERAEGVNPLSVFDEMTLEGRYADGGLLTTFPQTAMHPELLLVDQGPVSQPGKVQAVDLATGQSEFTIGPRLTGPVVTDDGRIVVIAGEEPRVSGLLDDGSLYTDVLALPPEVTNKTPSSDLVSVQEEGSAVVYSIWGEGVDAVLTRLPVGSTQLEVVQTDVTSPMALAATDEGRLLVVGPFETRTLDGSVSWAYDLEGDGGGQPVFGVDQSGLVGVVPLLSRQALLMLQADGTEQFIDLQPYSDVLFEDDILLLMSPYPVLADLDDDGRLDVLTIYGRRLMAFSQNGALLAGFPIKLSALSVAQPLVAELTGSGAWSIVVASTDGYVYAYDLGDRGRLVPGFPLAVGRSVRITPLLQDKTLYAVSEQGNVRAWQLDNLGAVWWSQLYANGQNQSYVELAPEPDPQPGAQAVGLIVEAETYNWPNPIRDGQTFLRCMTTADASVRITIIDAAGSLVDEVELDLRGGTPAEHRWQIDAASGLYYARVTATSTTGQTATKLIKMAIIR